MKITLTLLLLPCALTSPVFADVTAKPATQAPPATVLPVSAAVVSAPLVTLQDGSIGQPEKTELPAGGKAVFTFTVASAGEYVIHAVVNAPDEDSNSFYLNIDAPPEDPLMIWDVAVTKGFEERVVSWRGTGEDSSDEFAPKRFRLTAGAHKLILMGREPAQLKSVSIHPAPPAK